jgi:hypothetical protein
MKFEGHFLIISVFSGQLSSGEWRKVCASWDTWISWFCLCSSRHNLSRFGERNKIGWWLSKLFFLPVGLIFQRGRLAFKACLVETVASH